MAMYKWLHFNIHVFFFFIKNRMGKVLEKIKGQSHYVSQI